MFNNKNMPHKKGFTLIELMVVMAIMGVLSTIVLGSVSNHRAKARDTKRRMELKQINLAINLFYTTYGRMPKNYNCAFCGGGGNPLFCAAGNGCAGACEAPVPGVPGGESTNLLPEAYNASMQELVSAGFLSEIPHSSGGPGYCYYDFGSNPTYPGVLLMTALEYGPETVNGIPPSCRPWNSNGSTWCEKRNSLEYCFCNPY